MDEFINVAQASEILGFSCQTVRRLIRNTELDATRPPNAGKTTGYKIKAADVYALFQKRNAPKTEKQCPRCEQIKSLGEFNRQRSQKDGYSTYCHLCRKARYQEDIDRNRARGREYYRRNKEAIRKRHLARYSQHKDEINAKNLEYYKKHREEINAAIRTRYATDTEYRNRAREKANIRHRERYQNDPEYRIRSIACSVKYTNLKRGASTAEIVDRQAIIERDKATCYICGIGSLTDSEIHLDHVIPLSKGGPHIPDNIRVTCISCNCKKSDRSLAEVHELIAQGKW